MKRLSLIALLLLASCGGSAVTADPCETGGSCYDTVACMIHQETVARPERKEEPLNRRNNDVCRAVLRRSLGVYWACKSIVPELCPIIPEMSR